jgi:hypothetical protein
MSAAATQKPLQEQPPYRSTLKHKTLEESLASSYSPSSSSGDGEGSHIKFAMVNIWFFLMTIGDNPSVKKGPPVQLEWKAQYHEKLKLEDMEAQKKEKYGEGPWTKKYPRMVLPILSTKRFEILKENGLESSEVLQAIEDAAITRDRRRSTVMHLPRADFDEKMENVKDKILCRKHEELDYPDANKGGTSTYVPVPMCCGRPCPVRCKEILDNPSGKCVRNMYGKGGSIHVTTVCAFTRLKLLLLHRTTR